MTTEIAALLFPAMTAVAGGILRLVKYGHDTRAQRETRYRFTKEFLNDLARQPQMPLQQLQKGYVAIGGPPRRTAAEIRCVLDIAQRHDEAVHIHATAALGRVTYCEHLQTFEWRGIMTRPWLRSLIDIALLCWYCIGVGVSSLVMANLVARGVVPTQPAFWFAGAICAVYGVLPALLALLYAVRLDQTAILIHLTGHGPEPTWRVQLYMWKQRIRAAAHRICGHWLAFDRRGDRGSGYRGMMR
jgi:hypothetical protein